MTDLVPVSKTLVEPDARRTALVKLNQAAEGATDAGQAREIMVQAEAIADILTKIRGPLEDAKLAGKAAVVAGRKVGRILATTDTKPRSRLTHENQGRRGRGRIPSERGELRNQLGLSANQAANLIRLASVPDPDFQRYIQLADRIPTVNGCLAVYHLSSYKYQYRKDRNVNGWRQARRNNAGVQTPKNPSLDEGYSLIVRALGHISAVSLPPHHQKALSAAIEHLYAAEDLLKPFRGGYVS